MQINEAIANLTNAVNERQLAHELLMAAERTLEIARLRENGSINALERAREQVERLLRNTPLSQTLGDIYRKHGVPGYEHYINP